MNKIKWGRIDWKKFWKNVIVVNILPLGQAFVEGSASTQTLTSTLYLTAMALLVFVQNPYKKEAPPPQE